MFKLYGPGAGSNDLVAPRLLPQQRAWLADKMVPHGVYHDLLTRSLYYLHQPSHTGHFRPPLPGHMHAPLRNNMIGSGGRLQEGLAPYMPFDPRIISNRNIFYDTLKTKLKEDGKQSGEITIDTLTPVMTSPHEFSSGNNMDTLVTSSSALSPETKKSFTCPQCKYSTDRKNNLKRHVITMHFDCDRKLECCGTIFRSKAKLREHVTLFHKNGYRCLVCARMFCRKALLRRHMAVHSGKKDFHCEFCSYATSHKSNLERHQKVHAKSARFIYTQGKHGQALERNLFPIQNNDESVRDNYNTQKDGFGFEESRDRQHVDVCHFDEGGVSKPNIETVSMPDKNLDDTETCDSDTCVKVGDHTALDTDDEMMGEFEDRDDIDACTETTNKDSEVDTHSTRINYMFQPFYRDIDDTPESWKHSATTTGMVNKDVIDNSHIYYKLTDDKHTGDKENQDISESDTIQGAPDVTPSIRKLFPRLCGLPYRCANCSARFESQERFNQHRCQSAGTGDEGTIQESSVSLVALILKQGKNGAQSTLS